ncbi:MAG TPA: chemotaxis protein CheX [Gemmataceae bacterium]|nr:chemotaxis protein CheX [Gemmataceae bacterium]
MDTPDKLVEAFTAAVPFALREMAGVEAVATKARPATAADEPADLSAVVPLVTPGGDGLLILSLPERTATGLTRRVLAGSVDEVDADMVRDCVGELANVMAGQAKALLVGSPSHFVLSTPKIWTGGLVAGGGRWVILFESDAGDFAVHLCSPS